MISGLRPGQLDLTVVGKADGMVTIARTSIRHEEGKFHAPPGSLYRLQGQDLHFYAEGLRGLNCPPADTGSRPAKGPEYRVAQIRFRDQGGRDDGAQGRDGAVDRPAEAQGWYSGENHIHANYGYGSWYNSPRTMRAQCAGEDLSVGNFMVANSDGDGVFDREFFRGRPDPLSTEKIVLYWNEEFRARSGAT